MLIANDIIENEGEHSKLKVYKESLLSFLSERNIDGEQLMKYERKQFGKDVVSHCDDNKKLNGPSMKLLKALRAFEVNKMNKMQEWAPTDSLDGDLNDDICSNELSVSNDKELSAPKPGMGSRTTSQQSILTVDSEDTDRALSVQGTSFQSLPMETIPEPLETLETMESLGSVERLGRKHKRNNSAPVSPNCSSIQRISVTPTNFGFPGGSTHDLLPTKPSNSKLSELDQDAFCEWVIKCVSNGKQSRTVETMKEAISVKLKLSGKQMIEHIGDEKEDGLGLSLFIQNEMECNDIYFLQYLTDRIMDDQSNHRVPFENQTPAEFAKYVESQRHCLVADEFRKHGIDGKAYCSKDSRSLIAFLGKECGYKVGVARSLMMSINKYPMAPIKRAPFKSPKSAYSLLGGQGGRGHRKMRTLDLANFGSLSPANGAQSSCIRDDASDASETSMASRSYSVMIRRQTLSKPPEELFAEHAVNIYERYNERHWRRIGERLEKVGITNLLPYLRAKDEDDHDEKAMSSESGAFLDEKYLTKQAKLVYKIDEDRFYNELFQDIMNEALEFDKRMDAKQTKKWLVRYELNKLHHVIKGRMISVERFKAETKKDEDLFCKEYLGFLPKKRRKKLIKKLKKDINKGKLNGKGF